MAIFAAVPFTLTNGSIADATQVMADFNQIVANGNANAAPLASPAFSGTVTMPDASTWAGTGVANLVSLGVNRASPGTGIVDISGTYRIAGAVQATGVAGQLPGTATNDSASAGNVGELIRTAVAQGTPVNLTSPNTSNLGSIALTAGDWDVWMNLGFVSGGTNTQVNWLAGGITTTSATLPTSTGENATTVTFTSGAVIFANAGIYVIVVGPMRVSLAGNTTYYGVGASQFSTNTLGLFGTIQGRRRR